MQGDCLKISSEMNNLPSKEEITGAVKIGRCSKKNRVKKSHNREETVGESMSLTNIMGKRHYREATV